MVSDFGIPFFATALLTPFVRFAALRLGWTHRFDPRKWKRKANPHSEQIAMGGGLAMLLGFVATVALNPNPQLLFISLLAFYASVLGFYDDMRSPHPIYRLIAQTSFGIVTVAAIGWIHGLPTWLSVPIAIFGIVGLMNSVNMMDNMDGVASGLVALSMLGYATLGWLTKNELASILGLVAAGTTLGFWVHNKPPATIFMGDTGSLMLGYLLATAGIIASWGDYTNSFSRLVAPLLLVVVFITDTTFVVLWRKIHGLPIMQGDRNHISHRLAILFGGSEWKANFALYAVQSLMTIAAIVVAVSDVPIALAISLLASCLLGLLSWRLWQVRVD